MPRPIDMPLDGSCEANGADVPCLGLLEPHHFYHSKVFQPPLTFTVPGTGWQNRSEDGGHFGIESTTAPGDMIIFFLDPQVKDPTVASTVGDLMAWLRASDQLTLTPTKPVKIGGLSGTTVDITVAPTATNADPSCPVQVCVPFFVGRDPNTTDLFKWKWDWGAVSGERQRMYLLTSKVGVVAIFVDSLDGRTFDAMTLAFDVMTPDIKFG